ncbi:MAG: hypothetical protein LCH88_11350 [Proteobacteria bacterium]|nr:hypothetical protein [Pseudomonadota bacterium]
MPYVPVRSSPAKCLRPHIAARANSPVRPAWGWALPLVLMVVALMVPVVAGLSLRAALFVPG